MDTKKALALRVANLRQLIAALRRGYQNASLDIGERRRLLHALESLKTRTPAESQAFNEVRQEVGQLLRKRAVLHKHLRVFVVATRQLAIATQPSCPGRWAGLRPIVELRHIAPELHDLRCTEVREAFMAEFSPYATFRLDGRVLPVVPHAVAVALAQERRAARQTDSPVPPAAPVRRVVCAAIRVDGLVICGVRHFDALMHAQTRSGHGGHADEGFVDNHGDFLTRGQAWAVARSAGQILRRVGGDTADGGCLYSENLY